MAVISTPNATSVKVKFDHGADVNGDRILKTKTLTNIKSSASDDRWLTKAYFKCY